MYHEHGPQPICLDKKSVSNYDQFTSLCFSRYITFLDWIIEKSLKSILISKIINQQLN